MVHICISCCYSLLSLQLLSLDLIVKTQDRWHLWNFFENFAISYIMQNLIVSWWHFWTKCDNELLMILAIDSNLTIGMCTYTYLSFKKFQHEDSGAFIFWLMFLAFSYWYFGFGVYYDVFKEKGAFFAFNHLKVN